MAHGYELQLKQKGANMDLRELEETTREPEDEPTRFTLTHVQLTEDPEDHTIQIHSVTRRGDPDFHLGAVSE